MVQLTYTGFYVISKFIFDKGVSTYVFVFYRQAAASLLKKSPPLTPAIVGKLFLHALIGIESLKLKSLPGIGKATGITLCFAGVMTIALYKGPHISPLYHLHGHRDHNQSSADHASAPSMATWIKGSLFVIISNLTWSMWLVLQGKILKEFPSKILFTTLQSLFSAFQSLFVAMAFEREASKWKLQFDMGLVAVLYGGFIVTAVSFYLQSWIVEKKGPVFVAIFTPLGLVFTMLCSIILLGEVISLGSVVGGFLMVGGLYSVLWGKSKENMLCDLPTQVEKSDVQEKETT
ncbi:hypothetical protein ZIOFF_005546 [Zingiber officinale]|uniref:WAT1-related protein n=1 Tax=Zingiber officinale TaxID=94328 RepID=A0A8J5I1J7_ZINOF|nr:hypothetical protein ZIOFF_005546 [Zingiber officinale]